MDQARTSTHHGSGSGSGTVPDSGTAGTLEGTALAEAVGLAADTAADMAEGIASQARRRAALGCFPHPHCRGVYRDSIGIHSAQCGTLVYLGITPSSGR